jgi:hypothetical protein
MKKIILFHHHRERLIVDFKVKKIRASFVLIEKKKKTSRDQLQHLRILRRYGEKERKKERESFSSRQSESGVKKIPRQQHTNEPTAAAAK